MLFPHGCPFTLDQSTGTIGSEVRGHLRGEHYGVAWPYLCSLHTQQQQQQHRDILNRGDKVALELTSTAHCAMTNCVCASFTASYRWWWLVYCRQLATLCQWNGGNREAILSNLPHAALRWHLALTTIRSINLAGEEQADFIHLVLQFSDVLRRYPSTW